MMETRVKESRKFKLSPSKVEYMKCNFSLNDIRRGAVKLQEKEIASCGCFKYLGSILRAVGTSNKV